MTSKRMIELLKEYLKMNSLSVAELEDVNKFRLNEINKHNRFFQ